VYKPRARVELERVCVLEYILGRQVKTDWQRLAQIKGEERPWELNR